MPQPVKYDRGYRVNFNYEGRKIRKKFPAHKFPDPKKAAQNYINSILTGYIPDDALLQDQIDEYLNWADSTGKKRPSTLRTDRLRLNVFSEFTSAKSARNITVQHIRAFQIYFLENHPLYKHPTNRTPGNKYATWDRYKAAISAFLNWCKSRHYAENNPILDTDEFKSKQQERLPQRIYTQGELRQIFSYFKDDKELSVFFRILAYTGMRLGEVRQLEWKSIHSDTIQVQGETKSRKVRSIPIHPKLKPYLSKFKRKGRLFPRSGDTYYKKLQRAIRGCDLPPGKIHDFRHTFGAALAKEGVHIAGIKELMGHQDIKTTMRYLHFAPKHLSDYIGKLRY